ncbi:helix-turn-helix transcriptional regulator [Martelella lutilitoris]
MSRSTIYDYMKKGEFPRPVRMSERCVAWPESAISKWLSARKPTGS